MQLTPRQILTPFARLLQTALFPIVEQEIGTLTPATQLVAAIVGMLPLAKYVLPSRGFVGHPRDSRPALATAFLAKAVLDLPTTRDRIDRLRADEGLRRLCGWKQASDLPHESTFSRAFAEFARTELPQRLHEGVIAATQNDRLVGHIARDSTAIEVRERYDTLPTHKPLPPRVGGRPKKGGRALPSRRLPRQRRQPALPARIQTPSRRGRRADPDQLASHRRLAA